MISSEFEIEKSHIRIFCQDCLVGMREHLSSESVDIVVTSPPYNLGIRYSAYDDTIPRDDYLRWIGEWAEEVKRVLKDNGSLFLNVGGTPRDPWLPLDVAQALREHFILQNTIHWIKSITIEKKDAGDYGILTDDLTAGHFKPIQSRRFLNDCHEYLFHFTKSGEVPINRLAVGIPYQDKSNVSRWRSGGSDLRCRGNNWFVPYKTICSRQNQRPHPATFPVELARKAILLHGAESEITVCDPFLGIGHAGVAAIECGVHFIGFEIDEEYFATAEQMLKAMGTKQTEIEDFLEY